MNDLEFTEDGSPTFQEYDIVNLGRTGFVKVSHYYTLAFCAMCIQNICLNRGCIKVKRIKTACCSINTKN